MSHRSGEEAPLKLSRERSSIDLIMARSSNSKIARLQNRRTLFLFSCLKRASSVLGNVNFSIGLHECPHYITTDFSRATDPRESNQDKTCK